MGSNERDKTTQHHPPHISSLVVRPSGSNEGEGSRHAAADEEVFRDRPSFARSDRRNGDNGHRARASSSSPARRAYDDHRHGSDFNHSGAPPRGREFNIRREESGRHRDYSPPYARGGAGPRPQGRGFDGPEHAHGPFKSDGVNRNYNSKVQPRDGDWYCPDPLCRNLNFARRECCYKCKRHRNAPANSPPPPPRLLPPPPKNLSPRRDFNGYRSPPRDWPRDYPPPRHGHPTWRDRDRERDRLHFSDREFPLSRRISSDWVHTEQFPKPPYERRPPGPPLSPPLPPPRGGRWERSRSPLPLRHGPPPPMRGGGPLSRERSRSPPLRRGSPPPMRGGGPLPIRDYRRDSYFDRGGRDDRRGGRDRM